MVWIHKNVNTNANTNDFVLYFQHHPGRAGGYSGQPGQLTNIYNLVSLLMSSPILIAYPNIHTRDSGTETSWSSRLFSIILYLKLFLSLEYYCLKSMYLY